jgi:hypothetical protein
MGKLTGAALIVAGVTIAAYALSERQRSGAEDPAPVVRAEARTDAAPGSAPPPQGQAKPDDAAPETPQQVSAPPPVPPAVKSPDKSPEPRPQPTGKYIPPPAPLRIADAPPRVPVDKNKLPRTASLDREGLTREIQRELKRVGCYGGAITGAWSPAVRRAMKAFTDRANATLPVEQPDQILLALVQNNQRVTCSASCPPGQAVGGDGRCLPGPLVVRNKKPTAPAKEPIPALPAPQTPDDTNGPTPAPAAHPTGRMSLAGPPPVRRPARHRAATSAYPKDALRYAPTARPSRHANTRARERRRAARPPPGPFAGMPWWAVPLFSP